MLKFLIGILAVLVSLSAVSAETLYGTVKKNQSALIDKYGIYNKHQCIAGPIPKVKIKQQPKHGKITVKRAKVTFPKGKRCAGKSFATMDVFYKPDRGYTGTDSFKTSYSIPRGINSSEIKYRYKTYKLVIK